MIVGLTGRAQHGKDTVADELVRHYEFSKMSFAAPLKELALAVNPYVGEVVEGEKVEAVRLATVVADIGWEEAKKVAEVRRFLQELGTQARNFLGEDIWVDAARDAMPLGDVVFSDVRFYNEVELIRKLGGVLVRITRPGHDSGVDPNHPSERYVPRFIPDVELWNLGTVEDLRSAARDFIEMERAVQSGD